MLSALFLAVLSITGANAALDQQPMNKPAYSQTFNDQFNVLKYTANMGPYSQRPGNGISTNPPEGCEIDQVVLFSRHGARYPTPPEVTLQKVLLASVKARKLIGSFTGSLSFLNDYNYFMDNTGFANLETPYGPYSGLANTHQYGAESSAKYRHLWDGQSVVPIFTDNYERDLETARAFGQGFFGFNYTNSAAINLYDSFDDGCIASSWTTCKIKIDPKSLTNPLRYPAFDVAARRLSKENKILMTADDVFGLMSIGSYEISIKGDSPWVNVFTTEEWIAFEYAYDALFDCVFGNQSPRSKAIGTLFADATSKLLNDGPEKALPLAITFAHDVDLLATLAALGLINPTKPIDPYKVTVNNNFRLTDIVPMGARFIAERLTCKGVSSKTSFIAATNGTDANAAGDDSASAHAWTNGTTTNTTNLNGRSAGDATFVRFILNDAVLPWDACYEGPGFSCPLEKYTQLVANAVQDNSYQKVCHSQPKALDFFWNYKTDTTLNYNMQDIPYQAGKY